MRISISISGSLDRCSLNSNKNYNDIFVEIVLCIRILLGELNNTLYLSSSNDKNLETSTIE